MLPRCPDMAALFQSPAVCGLEAFEGLRVPDSIAGPLHSGAFPERIEKPRRAAGCGGQTQAEKAGRRLADGHGNLQAEVVAFAPWLEIEQRRSAISRAAHLLAAVAFKSSMPVFAKKSEAAARIIEFVGLMALRQVNSVDTFHGGGGSDILVGGAQIDYLYGDGGDDVLIGGSGADSLDGGEGFDTVSYVDSAQAVRINLTLEVQAGGDAEGDVYVKVDGVSTIEGVRGSNYNDTLTGDRNFNILIGGDGNDTLVTQKRGANLDADGRYLEDEQGREIRVGGVDILDGGAGRDVYQINSNVEFYSRFTYGFQLTEDKVNLPTNTIIRDSDGLGHYGDSYRISAVRFRPGFPAFTTLPSLVSSPSRKAASPTGRPVISARRRRSNSDWSGSAPSSAAKSPTRSCAGESVVMPSGWPVRCARALDQGQSCARKTSPARTGLRLT
jgi:Ca2+-binding RTX toxin-like protein